MHGGVPKTELATPNVEAVEKGLVNLEKHIENVKKFHAIAVVSFLGVLAYVVLLMGIWYKRRGLDAFAGLWEVVRVSGGLSLVAGVVAWLLARQTLQWAASLPSIWPYVLALLTSGIVFVCIYVPLVWKLAPQLLAPVLNRLRPKGKE